MLRNLQTNGSTFANAMNKAKVDMKRGSFVTVDNATLELKLANGIAGAKMVNRGTKLTKEIAMGFEEDVYSDEQDIIKAGEKGYLNELEGRWATTEYDATSITSDTAIDSYLTIANGKLTTSGTPTIIKFIGFIQDGDHKLVGVEFDYTIKLA